MADIRLVEKAPLGSMQIQTAGCELRALPDISVTSLAVPLGRDATFDARLEAAFGLKVPSPRISTLSGDLRAIVTGPDQMLVMQTGPQRMSAVDIKAKVEGCAYVTDQTGSWCALELSGGHCRSVLERLCPIDLHDEVFGVNAFARTVMEHLGVIIIRTEADRYWLLSASSSAQSFWHSVRTTLSFITQPAGQIVSPAEETR